MSNGTALESREYKLESLRRLINNETYTRLGIQDYAAMTYEELLNATAKLITQYDKLKEELIMTKLEINFLKKKIDIREKQIIKLNTRHNQYIKNIWMEKYNKKIDKTEVGEQNG